MVSTQVRVVRSGSALATVAHPAICRAKGPGILLQFLILNRTLNAHRRRPRTSEKVRSATLNRYNEIMNC